MKLFHNFNAKYLFDLSRNYTAKRSLIRLHRYLRTVAQTGDKSSDCDNATSSFPANRVRTASLQRYRNNGVARLETRLFHCNTEVRDDTDRR